MSYLSIVLEKLAKLFWKLLFLWCPVYNKLQIRKQNRALNKGPVPGSLAS